VGAEIRTAGTRAMTPDDAKIDATEDDSRRSADAAQQLSAWVWLMPLWEACLCPSALCMGQFVSLMQQAIRASGVDCQPAHTATFPTARVRIVARAARRRVKITMPLECGDAPCRVKPLGPQVSPVHAECQPKTTRKHVEFAAESLHRRKAGMPRLRVPPGGHALPLDLQWVARPVLGYLVAKERMDGVD